MPGLHYENYIHAPKHWPTMIYNASWDTAGSLQMLSVYACEKGGKASFQLLSRHMHPAQELVDTFIQGAARLGLDVTRLVPIDFGKCKWGWWFDIYAFLAQSVNWITKIDQSNHYNINVAKRINVQWSRMIAIWLRGP